MIEHAKYTQFNAEQLLADDYFIHSHHHPTPSSKLFWKSLADSDPIFHAEYFLACSMIEEIRQEVKQFTLSETQQENLYNRIQEKIQGQPCKTARRKILRPKVSSVAWVSIAASLALFLSMAGYLFYQSDVDLNVQNISDRLSKAGFPQDKISLSLSSEQLIMSEKEANLSYDAMGRLQLNGTSRKIGKGKEFNILHVPAGCRSSITLSDGTKMWVNADTKVVYHPLFTKNKREIYVDGEVFLDVAKDHTRPFIVKTSKLEVEVKGTAFNVSSYAKEDQFSVVLVEGEVRITDPNSEKTCLLAPNEKLAFSQEKNLYQKTEVDVSPYVAWKGGYYLFKQESLKKVFHQLSRYYGQEITCDEQVAALTCSGKLDIKSDLENVLHVMSHIAPIQVIHHTNKIHLVLKP